MKLIELKPSDRFYLDGKKYSVFFTLKNPPRVGYGVWCMNWPMCEYTKQFHSDTEVKPIVRS